MSSVLLSSFTGGTSKYKDLSFISSEENFNMFEETLECTETYTTKALRQLEGSSVFAELLNESGGCRGLYVASTSPLSSVNVGDELLYGVFGSNLYRIYSDKSYYKLGSVGNNDEIVTFAETSGVPPYVCICSNNQILAVCLSTEDSETTIDYLTLPIRAGTDETPIVPTYICSLNYRIIVNDYLHDYFYYSELGKPNGVDNAHAFYQYKTRYQYTKNDGTIVSFSDNQYYPPTQDSYTGELESETVWMGSLNFQKSEFKADNITGVLSADSYMITFGTTSYQIFKWQDSLYDPYVSTTKNGSLGCRYIKTATVLNNNIVFLGSSSAGENSIWKINSSEASKISTKWLERQISTMTVKSDAFGFSYTKDGHQFYIITFPSANRTYCYDFSEDSWHIRATRSDKNEQLYWYPSFSFRCYGKILLGSFTENKILYLDENKFTDYNGRLMQRSRETGITINDFNNIIIQSLELICDNGNTPILQTYDEEGKALSTEGYNPNVILQLSYDGGRTWGTEMWSKMGRQGQYSYRTVWNRLGMGRKIAFRVLMTDPAPFNIAKAKLTFTKCGK
jgi:hypothetical protein